MTTEEKLQHFYDVAIGEAQAEADQILADYKKQLAKQFEDYKAKKEQEAKDWIKSESFDLQREVNKELSVYQLHIKREWTKKQAELKSKLFDEVAQRLQDFKKTPEYIDYLIQKTKSALALADGSSTEFYLTSSDADKRELLEQKTGVTFQISKDPFMGGIKVLIPARNMAIDYSLLELYEKEKKTYTLDGGLTYE
ncbi:MAG: V-type ATP synthase subunit E [Lachnospiraceae bacterium]